MLERDNLNFNRILISNQATKNVLDESAVHDIAQLIGDSYKLDSNTIWQSNPGSSGDKKIKELIGVGSAWSLEVKGELLTKCCNGQCESQPLVKIAKSPLLAFNLLKPITNISDTEVAVPYCAGFMGYESARYCEPIKNMPVDQSKPDFYMVVPQIFFSRSASDLFLFIEESIPNKNLKGIAQSILQITKTVKTKLSKVVDLPKTLPNTLKDQLAHTPEIYKDKIKRCKDYITNGDIFQVVLANHFISNLEQSRNSTQANPNAKVLEDFRYLTSINPSPYQFLFHHQSCFIIGASPEQMLKSSKNKAGQTIVSIRPVAGTIRSIEGSTKDVDELFKTDIKENAEHMMLVDHIRNDLGRVSKIGSVEVLNLLLVEKYSNVHHLVSEVCGILEDTTTVFDALEATFPIATLTGTPKIRAMEIIAELEKIPRGLFGGAAIALDSNGELDSAVIIRTIYYSRDNNGDIISHEISAGGGIVYDSNPTKELKETFLKMSPAIKTYLNSK